MEDRMIYNDKICVKINNQNELDRVIKRFREIFGNLSVRRGDEIYSSNFKTVGLYKNEIVTFSETIEEDGDIVIELKDFLKPNTTGTVPRTNWYKLRWYR